MEITHSNNIASNKFMVSIVIPVFNVEAYLEKCLNSLLNQTYKDYEIILINDGSTDRSGMICDAYAAKYDFIKVFHQTNQGQAVARNFGVEKAKSDWIVFVDSDDVAHPQMVEFFIKAQSLTNASICACKRLIGEHMPDGFMNEKKFSFRKHDINEDSLYQFHAQNLSYYWALFPSMISKEIYQKHKMPVGRIYEDNAICCQWLYAAGEFAEVPLELYFYRKNPDSTMHKKFSEKQLDTLWALQEQIKFFDSVGYTRLLNVAFNDYVDAAIGMFIKVGEELNDAALQKKILRSALDFCERYKDKIDCYNAYIERLKKRLHPLMHKIKKAIKSRIKI